VTLEVAKLIREIFLQQNLFTVYDKYCPFYKTAWMLKILITFHDCAQRAVKPDPKQTKHITWNTIKKSMDDVIDKIWSMRFKVILFFAEYAFISTRIPWMERRVLLIT
jgi:V-type H+-transporting ATPase subunit A